MKFTETVKSADWKSEKHVPAIEAPSSVKKAEKITAHVVVGAEIKHPNTTAHHIESIDVYFQPDGGTPYQLGHFSFDAHGAGADGADSSGVYTDPEATVNFSSPVSGTIYATSYCNIHGVWENSWHVDVK